jgi:hypothetical protein
LIGLFRLKSRDLQDNLLVLLIKDLNLHIVEVFCPLEDFGKEVVREVLRLG